ncbi:iron-containing alcohol dehydrogenase [Streptomyces malaysiensis subsp. malaysiensis]|uniref:Iron-containing alcohol dehydrogenase n=1 Tax=Streptomyces malaysiensis TaxID=92644 RepID=A0ABX6WHL9_STRMQ|nr:MULTISPECIES: iron-containing alcohol dehydrogenase [Streptomyces]QPI60608.1 iron-containing alcohol dehydrogenase [Streptomyces solisilvae]UHH22326.1 iron-containing alcohol dehydrogenase [Streptomyces sp. HNM0561]
MTSSGPGGPTPLSIDPTCRIEFGPGRIGQLPALIAATGHDRAFVVTDRGLRAAGVLGPVLKALDTAGLEYAVHDEVAPNPSTANVDAGAARARAFGTAAVVALGGGSVLDAAKGIALLVGNPDATAADADDLWEAADGLPLVAIPTTSGTGAETNGFGVIEDTAACRKVYLGHPSVKPRIALLDPELTLGLPAPATAATGIDALVHGVESLASRGANPVSTAYATQAVAMVSRALPAAYADGSDLDARAELMLGAHLAGQALTLSGLGLVHGIGHALTAHTGTPHGVALAAVLEEVMEFNAPAARNAYEQVARAMRLAPPADGDWARTAIEGVRELAGTVDVKRPLRTLGADRDMLPSIATGAVADAVTKNNPLPPDHNQVLDILTATY